MSHPLDVFDPIDDLTPTDLWSDIAHRRPGPDPEPPVSPSRRVRIIVVAFLIAAAAIVVPIVVITQTPDPIPSDTQEVIGHGVARNPMGIPITLAYPPDWYAGKFSQSSNLDPTVDAERQVGLVISNAPGAMPTVSDSEGADAGPLPENPDLPPSYVTVTIIAIEGEQSTRPDSDLPLSMDTAKVAPGGANIRYLDARVGGVPLTIQVQGGPKYSDEDLAEADAIVASIRPEELRVGATAASSNPGAIADVLVIDCTDEGTVVAVPVVEAQDDGAHFEVDNRSGVDEVLIAPAGDGGDDWGGDMDLSSATSHVFDFAPGELMVGCFTDEGIPRVQVRDWSELPGMVPVTIAEPAGGYVSADLSCPAGASSSGITSFGNSGPFPTPEDAARALLIGLEGTDLIERAGYPAQRSASDPGEGVLLRVVREGEVVASIAYSEVGATPILRVEACEQSSITGAPAVGGSPVPAP
jgi:hypothetical protein